jgi:hypothetical protein
MKKKLFISFMLVLFLIGSVSAAQYVDVIGYTPFAFERITATTATVSRLNATYRESAGAVFITVETNNIRYRIDAGNPDAVNGHLVVATSYQNIWLNDPYSIKNFRSIAIGGNSTLIVTYYRKN